MKKLENGLSVGAIIMAILGLVLLLFPNLTNTVIVCAIGSALIVYGSVRVVRYLKGDAVEASGGQDITIGLICIVCGIFMLIYRSAVIGILPFLYGLALVMGGAMSIQTAFDMKRFGSLRWTWHLLVGIAFAVVGIVVLRNAAATAAIITRLGGIGMLVEGIYMCATGVSGAKLRKAFRQDDIGDVQ